MAHHKAKRTKIWASGVFVVCMLVFLTLNILRSFGVIRCTFPNKSCNSRTAHRRAKGTKIWAMGRGVYITCMLVFLTLNSKGHLGQGHLGHSVHFSKKLGRDSKMAHYCRVKKTKNLDIRGVWRMHVGIYVGTCQAHLRSCIASTTTRAPRSMGLLFKFCRVNWTFMCSVLTSSFWLF